MGIGERSFWINLDVVLISVVLLFGVGEGYKNYTVGDSLGWYDTLIKPSADYQAWADAKSFTLGDFLIFNTDNNHSVVQTYNISSYNSCDYTGDDSIEWSTSRPSNTEVSPVTVAVPLLKEGATYFFSGDYDGWQCHHGQQFAVNVSRGQGLPPSLKASPPESAAAAPSPDADDSIPDSALPDFSHPKNPQSPQSGGGGGDGDGGSEDSKAEASRGGLVFGGGPGFGWALLVVLMGLCW